jgi:hypothetical protein
MAQKVLWYPGDAGRFDWAMRTYQNWHMEDAETYLMAFPWPEPGEIPDIPGRYFVPTEVEGAKIQWLVDNFSGEDDPWLKDMIALAKELVKEVHLRLINLFY